MWSRRVEVFSGRSLIESKSNKSKCQRIAKFKFGLLCLFCPKNSHPIEFFFSISWHFDSSGQTISTCWHSFFDILKRIFRSLARIFHSFFDCLTLFFDPSDNFFRPDDTFNFRSLQTFLSICWHPFFSTCWHLSSTSCQNFYRLENTTFRSDDTFIFWFSRPWDTIFSVSW